MDILQQMMGRISGIFNRDELKCRLYIQQHFFVNHTTKEYLSSMRTDSNPRHPKLIRLTQPLPACSVGIYTDR